jgi:hypothetical protein
MCILLIIVITSVGIDAKRWWVFERKSVCVREREREREKKM